MKPLLIAFHGLPGSGKDTLAKYLISNFHNWDKLSWAEPIKHGLATMLNIPMEDIDNPNIKNIDAYKFGKSIRYMTQTLGTEWGRNLIHNDIWVELGKEKIIKMLNSGINVVNTDLRFDNEAKVIKEFDGIIIHIIRKNNPYLKLSSTNGVKNHPSNMTLDENFIDYRIDNSDDIQFMVNQLMNILGTKNGHKK